MLKTCSGLRVPLGCGEKVHLAQSGLIRGRGVGLTSHQCWLRQSSLELPFSYQPELSGSLQGWMSLPWHRGGLTGWGRCLVAAEEWDQPLPLCTCVTLAGFAGAVLALWGSLSPS